MHIAVLGTGMVGRTIAGRLAGLGHETALGTRDVAATMARSEPDAMGGPPVRDWLAEHRGVRLLSYPDAGVFGELFVNATSGSGSLAALHAVGPEHLAGRVLIDIANPLDFSAGFPPTLWVKDTDSLGEQIQAALPDTQVVKALNTVTAAVMVAPQLVGDGRSSIFVSGNDPGAKAVVSGLLESFGWRDIIDLGGIETARGTEMYLPLWLRLMGALGTAQFNIAVQR
jgi:hypothetical protein